MNCVLFGDSYTAGRLPNTQTDGAFREALGVPLEDDFSVSGSTAQDWAFGQCGGRLHRVIVHQAEWAVGSLGGNDAFQAMADGVMTDAEAVGAMAALLFVLHRLRGKRVLLMLYPDPYRGRNAQAAQGHKKLVQAIQEIARIARWIGVNVETIDLEQFTEDRFFDGVDIHPNRDGYAAYAAAVRKRIEGRL